MEYDNKVEIIEIPAPKIECCEIWANGKLLARTINGKEFTPPELILSATEVVFYKQMSREEFKKVYG